MQLSIETGGALVVIRARDVSTNSAIHISTEAFISIRLVYSMHKGMNLTTINFRLFLLVF